MAKSARTKPNKPFPTFPLTAHPNGQWCKKIHGTLRFFGVWEAPDHALEKYHALAADLHANRLPRPSTVSRSSATVKVVCNAYLAAQHDKFRAGEIGARWFEDCRKIITAFATALGKDRPISDVRPEDLRRYRHALAQRLGVHALTRHITAVRSALRYAYENDVIAEPIKIGTSLANPTAAQRRRAKSNAELENGKKLFSAKELRSVLDASPQELLAPILLGINGGFGNTDCATLPRAAIDLTNTLVSYARPKTGVSRVVPLWPETVDALRPALASVERPTTKRDTGPIFRTATGKPLVRQSVKSDGDGTLKAANIDELSAQFSQLLKSLGIHRSGLGFYSLRHTFRTWADETRDQHAIHRIMGHAIPGMSGIYVEEIRLDRLRAVTDYVRGKLLG